jgi:hypothetical protein
MKEGNGTLQPVRKTFMFRLCNSTAKHFTNVQINYGNGESMSQIVKIIG